MRRPLDLDPSLPVQLRPCTDPDGPFRTNTEPAHNRPERNMCERRWWSCSNQVLSLVDGPRARLRVDRSICRPAPIRRRAPDRCRAIQPGAAGAPLHLPPDRHPPEWVYTHCGQRLSRGSVRRHALMPGAPPGRPLRLWAEPSAGGGNNDPNVPRPERSRDPCERTRDINLAPEQYFRSYDPEQ